VLNLVSKADQEFKILALGRVVSTKVLGKTFAEFPMLRFAIDMNIPVALWILTLLLVPGFPSLPVKDGVEKSGPSHHDEDNKVRGSEPGAGTVVDVNGGDGRGPAFFEVVSGSPWETLWHWFA
jgi:hypothetical protein